MTGQDLIDLVNSITEDNYDQDLILTMLNVARVNLEEERPWRYLIKVKDSDVASAGNNYLVGLTLPDDFALDQRVVLSDAFNELVPCLYEERTRYKDAYGYYYVNHADGTYSITGNIGSAQTIIFIYKRFTPEITISTSPVFPSRFHPILAFLASAYLQAGVDIDDVTTAMSAENKVQYSMLRDSMIMWNDNLMVRAMNNRAPIATNENTIGDFYRNLANMG